MKSDYSDNNVLLFLSQFLLAQICSVYKRFKLNLELVNEDGFFALISPTIKALWAKSCSQLYIHNLSIFRSNPWFYLPCGNTLPDTCANTLVLSVLVFFLENFSLHGRRPTRDSKQGSANVGKVSVATFDIMLCKSVLNRVR